MSSKKPRDRLPKPPGGRRKPPGPRPKGYDAFCELFLGGMSVNKIADQIGVNKRTCYRYKALFEADQASEEPVSGPARRHAADSERVAAADTKDLPVGELPPDPGDGFDPISIARRAACDPRLKIDTRLRAVSICESRRQFDITHNVHGSNRVDWTRVKREDIPPEERFRLAGALAEDLVQAREPGLSQPGTTEAQALVFYELGKLVDAQVAEEIAEELRAAKDRAKARLAEIAAAARPVVGPVDLPDASDYLSA